MERTVASDPTGFIPDKELLWAMLSYEAQYDAELDEAHQGKAGPIRVRAIAERVHMLLLFSIPEMWDRHFVRSVICEFCDPERKAFPDAERFEELVQHWNDRP